MRATLSVVALLAALAVGYAVFMTQTREVSNNRPLTQINLVAVRTDLLSLGKAEQLYLATNGSYATLEQLQHSGAVNSVPEINRGVYTIAAEVDGSAHFRITATPKDSSREDLPTLSIDETMQMTP